MLGICQRCRPNLRASVQGLIDDQKLSFCLHHTMIRARMEAARKASPCLMM